MTNIFLCLLLFSVSWAAEASETTFADIQKRVTKRDAITKAIMAVDEGRVLELWIKNDAVEIRIYRHMKEQDPKMEKYTFKLTDEILQEQARLELQKELQRFIEKCSSTERKYKITLYFQDGNILEIDPLLRTPEKNKEFLKDKWQGKLTSNTIIVKMIK